MNQLPMTELEEKLVQLFNETALPFEAKRYVVLSFFRNIEDVYQSQIKQNKEKQKQEGEEENV